MESVEIQAYLTLKVLLGILGDEATSKALKAADVARLGAINLELPGDIIYDIAYKESGY